MTTRVEERALRRRRRRAAAIASGSAAAVAAVVVVVVWALVPGVNPRADTLGAVAGLPTDDGHAPLTAPSAVPTASVLAAGVRVLSRIPTTDRVVFVGIDDGYVRLPEVARLLTQRAAPVSLFVTASSLEEEPAYFQSLVAAGATVENHSITHPLLTRLSEEAQQREICGASDTATRLVGRRPTLFRPPFGAYDPETLRAVHACSMDTVVLWDVAVNDGHVQFQSGDRLQPGDIVLMHFRKTGVEDLTALLTAIDDAGLRIASLEDYVSRLPAPTALPVVPPRPPVTTYRTAPTWRSTWVPPAVVVTTTAGSAGVTSTASATATASPTATGSATGTVTATATTTATATATTTTTATATATVTPRPTMTRPTATEPPPPPTTAPPATGSAAPTP